MFDKNINIFKKYRALSITAENVTDHLIHVMVIVLHVGHINDFVGKHIITEIVFMKTL